MYRSDMYVLNKNEFYKTRKQPKICFIKDKKLLKKYKSFTPCSFDKPYKNYKEEEIINNAKSSQSCENIINKNILEVDKSLDELSYENLYKDQNENVMKPQSNEEKLNIIELDNKKILDKFYKKLET